MAPREQEQIIRGRVEGAISVLETGGEFNREGLLEILREVVGDPGCPNREPSGVGASASDPTESGPELDHQEPEQGWPEEIVVTRYSGLMTFVSSEEEAREFAARPRVYVDKQKIEGLIGALEEIVALGASWPTGIAREAAQHVEIARAALSEFRGEDGRRG